MPNYDLGIDTGGTFTDCILMNNELNELSVSKLPSTPEAPAAAILSAATELLDSCDGPKRVRFFVHGSTVPTNTIIERTGEPVGLITTRGFRDNLFLRRVALPDPSDLFGPRPESLVKRRHVFEATERILADGSVDTPLDLEDIRSAAKALAADGISAVVVSFLHSYRNPTHEQQARACIAEMYPDMYVATSSGIWPRFREYERTLVAVLDSYVGPRVRGYLEEVRNGFNGLQREDNHSSFLVAKRNGGVMTVEAAIEHPAHCLHSGPAAGAIAALQTGREAGFERLVAWDMGGTSSDVTVILGDLPRTDESHVGDFSVYLPSVDINSIGAGGGSIAWIDASGLLRVGPQSAGAVPGPACYGWGGTEPTITDAYVALGMIPPVPMAGGKLRTRKELAHKALASLAVGARLGSSLEAADAVVRVATSKMYAQILPLVAKYGVDIKDLTLVAYGGAGPTHAFLVAQEVGFRRVLVPPLPGLLCAWGCLIADLLAEFPETVHLELSEANLPRLEQALQRLEVQAKRWIQGQRIDVVRTSLERLASMRYRGQAFELDIALPAKTTEVSLPMIVDAFHQLHRRRYGFSDSSASIDIIDVTVRARGERPKPKMGDRLHSAMGPGSDQLKQTSYDLFYEGRAYKAQVVNRANLGPGDRLSGPATVTQGDTTVFIPPGITAEVDANLNIIGELE
jgi:N-methylhydantoinase A